MGKVFEAIGHLGALLDHMEREFERTDAATRHAHADKLVEAFEKLNAELVSLRSTAQTVGVSSLEDLPGPELGGERIWLIYYQQAIVSHVQCALIESYRDFDTTASGDAKADGLEARIDSHRRDLRAAIASLQGLPRCTVELI
jgi:hypothetical protein